MRKGPCECGSDLELIRLFTHAQTQYAPSVELEYGDPHAKQSWWSGQMQTRGHVEAWRCPDCWRIYFYGVPEM